MHDGIVVDERQRQERIQRLDQLLESLPRQDRILTRQERLIVRTRHMAAQHLQRHQRRVERRNEQCTRRRPGRHVLWQLVLMEIKVYQDRDQRRVDQRRGSWSCCIAAGGTHRVIATVAEYAAERCCRSLLEFPHVPCGMLGLHLPRQWQQVVQVSGCHVHTFRDDVRPMNSSL